jgi:hypothetical protein
VATPRASAPAGAWCARQRRRRAAGRVWLGRCCGDGVQRGPAARLGVVLMVQFMPDTIYPLRAEFRDAVNADLA